MDINDIYLVNYRHSNCEPLKSITQLSEKEAYTLAKRLYEESPCRAHNRFGPNFEWYYNHRLKTEKWLYERFIAIGGKPHTTNPFYFALHNWEKSHAYFNFGKIIKIGLKDIDICDVSFTFGDSCKEMDSPNRKEPFLKDKLLEFISLNDNNVEKFLENIKQQYDCIEAQLWTDKYFDGHRTV